MENITDIEYGTDTITFYGYIKDKDGYLEYSFIELSTNENINSFILLNF